MQKIHIYFYTPECSLRGWYFGRAIALDPALAEKYEFHLVNHSKVFRGDIENVVHNEPRVAEYPTSLADYINSRKDVSHAEARDWLVDMQQQSGLTFGRALAAERHNLRMSHEEFVRHGYLTWQFFSAILESHPDEQVVFMGHYCEHFYDIILHFFAEVHGVPFLQYNSIWSNEYMKARFNMLDSTPYVFRLSPEEREVYSADYFDDVKALLEDVIRKNLYPQPTMMSAKSRTWSNIPTAAKLLYHRVKVEVKRGRKLDGLLEDNYLNIIRDQRFYLSRRVRRLLNEWLNNLLGFFTSEPDPDQPFYFFPLHHQPEAEILVANTEFNDQETVIRNVAAGLPVGTKLLIKGHPAHVGGFSPLFYRRLLSIPNVELIDPTYSSRELISRARGTISIKSTVIYEAMLLRKPVVMLGQTYYAFISPRLRCESWAELWKRMGEDDFYVPTDEELDAYLTLMAQGQIPGAIDRVPGNQESGEVNEEYMRYASDSFARLDGLIDIRLREMSRDLPQAL